MPQQPTPQLERAIRLPHATAMVVGTIIGTSIFVQPSEVTGRVPTVAGVFAVWIVCGVLTLFGALVCAELSSIFTRSGGIYLYLKEAYSPALGFLWGWAMFWTMHSGIIAAIAVVCGRYTAYFVPLDNIGIKAVGIAVIVILSTVNYVGVRHGSLLQTLFTAGKLLAIVLIIISGFVFGGAGATEFLLALVAGLFAFGGWHMVTYNAEETVAPRRTMSALVIFSAFGALAGIVLAGPRVYYAMAQDGLLFRWAAAVHPRYHTPYRAIVLQGIWSCVLVATGTYRLLFTRVIYTEWIFFGLMALGLIVLRRRNKRAGYRMWGYPLVPLLFAFSAFAIVINQVISSPADSLTGLGLVLVGLPVYALWARR